MVKNWRDVLIRSQTSIVETVEVIDRGVSRIALVVLGRSPACVTPPSENAGRREHADPCVDG